MFADTLLWSNKNFEWFNKIISEHNHAPDPEKIEVVKAVYSWESRAIFLMAKNFFLMPPTFWDRVFSNKTSHTILLLLFQGL